MLGSWRLSPPLVLLSSLWNELFHARDFPYLRYLAWVCISDISEEFSLMVCSFHECSGNFHGLFGNVLCGGILWVDAELLHGDLLWLASKGHAAAATSKSTQPSFLSHRQGGLDSCLHNPRVRGFIPPFPVQSRHRLLSFLSFLHFIHLGCRTLAFQELSF